MSDLHDHVETGYRLYREIRDPLARIVKLYRLTAILMVIAAVFLRYRADQDMLARQIGSTGVPVMVLLFGLLDPGWYLRRRATAFVAQRHYSPQEARHLRNWAEANSKLAWRSPDAAIMYALTGDPQYTDSLIHARPGARYTFRLLTGCIILAGGATSCVGLLVPSLPFKILGLVLLLLGSLLSFSTIGS